MKYWLALLLHFPLLGNAAVILQYHHVSDHTPQITSISPKKFREHMAYLKYEKFQVIALPEMLDALKKNKPLPSKAVAITFDDGYKNVFENARPILNEYQFPYTVFVNPLMVENKHGSAMTWGQLKTLQDEGVTIANHSQHHDYMVRQERQDSTQYFSKEILVAEEALRKHLGTSYRIFAYPYGEFSPKLQQFLSQHHFIGIGQHSGAVGPYTDFTRIPRFPASGIYADLNALKTKLKSLAFHLKSKLPEPMVYEKKPKLSIVFQVQDFKTKQLMCFVSGQGAVQPTIEKMGKNQVRLTIQAKSALPMGRSRYNCTAPSMSQPGRFYWFSQPWLVMREPSKTE